MKQACWAEQKVRRLSWAKPYDVQFHPGPNPWVRVAHWREPRGPRSRRLVFPLEHRMYHFSESTESCGSKGIEWNYLRVSFKFLQPILGWIQQSMIETSTCTIVSTIVTLLYTMPPELILFSPFLGLVLKQISKLSLAALSPAGCSDSPCISTYHGHCPYCSGYGESPNPPSCMYAAGKKL